MSILIRVDKPKPVTLELILPLISKSLRQILGLTFDPQMVAKEGYKPETILPPTHYINPGQDGDLRINCLDEGAIASVTTSEGKEYINTSPNITRSSVEHALACAVAVALAEYSECTVSESSLTYSKIFCQLARDFEVQLMPTTKFDDIRVAGQAFAQRLRLFGD